MSKRLFYICVILLLTLSLFSSLYVFAGSGELDYVTDGAGLLTEDERTDLNVKAEAASNIYGCDILIVTVDDKGAAHIEDYAQNLYDEYDLGYGDDKSGIMLVISMAERDYDIMAHGYGNVAFTDYGKDKLADKFLPDLSGGNYYKSFYNFIETCENYLDLARSGEPIDVKTDPNQKKKTGRIVLAVVPFLIALLTIFIQKVKMKTAKIQQMANDYITEQGLKLTGREDAFLYRNIIRTKRESSSGKSSGGTSVNSHGSSHKSGKF